MDQLTIPQGPEDLTPQWLTAALGSKGEFQDVSISSVVLDRVGTGSGFVGECWRITPTYLPSAPNTPASMVAKFPSPAHVRKTGITSADPEGKEIRFYMELAGDAGIGTPHVHYAAIHEGSGDYILIMEDLSDSAAGDDFQGRSDEDALLCVQRLATMHARWWDNPQIVEFPGQRRTPDQRQRDFQRWWRTCTLRLGHELSSGFAAISEALTVRLAEVSWVLAKRPQTLVHGDFRYDNMFFRKGEAASEPTVIDWALVERACGTYDLSYFAASSLHVGQRRRIEEELLSAYHEALTDQGIKDYTRSELLDDYRLAFVRFIELWVEAGAHLDLSDPRGHDYFLESMARLDAVLQDHGILEIVGRPLDP